MRNKSRKAPYKPTLQTFELVEITDPAEQAALDRRIREAEKMIAQREKMLAEVEAPKKAKPRKRK
jgi:hypothetical protein